MSEILTAKEQQIFMAQNSEKKKTVTTERRRPTTSSDQRERAEAPSRDRDAAPPPSSGGGKKPPRPPVPPPPPRRPKKPRPSGGGFGLPLSSGRLIVGLLLLACICGLPMMLFFNRDDEPSSASDNNAPIVELPTQPADNLSSNDSTTSDDSFLPPPASTEGQTWLIMLYADADDRILEQDIYLDMNETERAISNDRVHIVAQIDRFNAGYSGDGNWSSARRYYISQDDDLNSLGSQQIEDLGEVNMSDGNTLIDFATWAIETFPADKHVLIMSDHGMGWPGGWSDPTSGRNLGAADNNIPIVRRMGDEMYLMELDQALGEIRNQTGIVQFELIGMDACLMSHIEVYSALAPHARYAVASQETEPAVGWAYTGFLTDLSKNPDMTGADLGRAIVESYIHEDQRILDDQARAEMTNRGVFSAPSADRLASQLEHGVTLSAIDLAAIPNLLEKLNTLAYTLQDINQSPIAKARNHALSFTSIWGRNVQPSYLDLGSFVQILQRETRNKDISQAGDEVLTAIDQAVVAETHGAGKRGATGISIYFPNSDLYSSPVSGPESYTAVSRRFAESSLWDDFLAYHYTGSEFSPTAAELSVPGRNTLITAPGAATIELSPITKSGNVAAPGRPVVFSTDVSGENIGYIYFITGFYDEASNSIFVADTDYLQSSDTIEIDGVYYPDWGDEDFTLEFAWEPLMFAIDDGENTVLGALSPQSYGAAPEDAVYTIDGIYTYDDEGSTRYARLYFRNGVMQQVFGFTNDDGVGAAREIIPTPGDTFTVLETWLDLDTQGNVMNTATQQGGTLTFSNEPFTWIDMDAAVGEYSVGFVVEDLDGNANEIYTQITVR
jgi:hypothetical protein